MDVVGQQLSLSGLNVAVPSTTGKLWMAALSLCQAGFPTWMGPPSRWLWIGATVQEGPTDTVDFSFAAGDTSFSVTHYYVMQALPEEGQVTVTTAENGLSATASEYYPISVTVTSADNRSVTASNAASVTVYDPGPTVTMTGYPQDTDDACSLIAAGCEAGDPGATFTYHWTNGDYDISDQAEADFAAYGLDAALQVNGLLTVTDACGAEVHVYSTFWSSLCAAAGPTASITETDPGGMVFEGDAANFDIHVVFPDGTIPDTAMMVYYETVNGTAVAGTDYQLVDGSGNPLDGAQCVTVYCGDNDVGDKTFTVDTTGGTDGGGDKTFSVQLLTAVSGQPGLAAQGGTNGSATATIVRPEVDISSPDETSGTIYVSDANGGRAEVDLSATMDSGCTGQGTTTVQLVMPSGVGDLTFWTAETGGTQLNPDGDGVLDTFAMPSSGEFTGTVWVENDGPPNVEVNSLDTILAQVVPQNGPAVVGAPVAVTVTYKEVFAFEGMAGFPAGWAEETIIPRRPIP